jgi:hypothetical protein
MNELIAKLRLIAKAEAILIRLHLRRAVRQVSFVLAAAVFGLWPWRAERRAHLF